jgi:hypothetical protein
MFFIWSFLLSFFGLSIGCQLSLPQPPGVSATPTPEPYTMIGVLQQIPNVITNNYNTCHPSGSQVEAQHIINGTYEFIVVIIPYFLSCTIVTFIKKLKNKKTKKN